MFGVCVCVGKKFTLRNWVGQQQQQEEQRHFPYFCSSLRFILCRESEPPSLSLLPHHQTDRNKKALGHSVLLVHASKRLNNLPLMVSSYHLILLSLSPRSRRMWQMAHTHTHLGTLPQFRGSGGTKRGFEYFSPPSTQTASGVIVAVSSHFLPLLP